MDRSLDLTAVRARLEGLLQGLERRAEKLEGSLRRERTPLGSDWADAASVRQNDEVVEALDAGGRGRIEQIHAALGRIDAGTYGVCAACGEPIAAARLEALPEVATCMECAR